MNPICLAIISGLFLGSADQPFYSLDYQKVPFCDSARKREPSDYTFVELDPTLPSDSLTNAPQIRTKTKDFAAYEDVVYEYYVGKRGREIKHGLYQRVATAGAPGRVIESGYYSHNFRVGRWTAFYPDGQVRTESEYKDGKLNGNLTSYHPNGIISEQQNLADGRKKCDEDYSFGHHQNGKMKFEIRIRNGYLIQNSRYDTLGNIIRNNFLLEK